MIRFHAFNTTECLTQGLSDKDDSLVGPVCQAKQQSNESSAIKGKTDDPIGHC